MAKFRVELKASARKELERLPNPVLQRVVRQLEELQSNSRPKGCKKLVGGSHEWRMRVGDYRVIYTINDASSVVSIVHPAPARCL